MRMRSKVSERRRHRIHWRQRRRLSLARRSFGSCLLLLPPSPPPPSYNSLPGLLQWPIMALLLILLAWFRASWLARGCALHSCSLTSAKERRKKKKKERREPTLLRELQERERAATAAAAHLNVISRTVHFDRIASDDRSTAIPFLLLLLLTHTRSHSHSHLRTHKHHRIFYRWKGDITSTHTSDDWKEKVNHKNESLHQHLSSQHLN